MLSIVFSLIVFVIVIGFLLWAFQQLLPLIPVAEPFKTILRILLAALVLIFVIWFLMVLLGMAGVAVSVPTLHRY